ncbi:protein transport protein Sec24A [Pygocentrus nattereri]|uniref:protein transport protein Sec24A n=1 Tax=Pygocentrus nattereri TaxID=42514 RepID=UPI0018916182|nr:protein transport protein Sec24A [Pygocentrus nattereri]
MMSNGGFSSRNGASGPSYINGPFQNPITIHPSTQGYIVAQPSSTMTQSKAPLLPAPDNYNFKLCQQATPVSLYQSPSASSMPIRPPEGCSEPFAPSQPAACNHRMLLLPTSQSSSTPPVSNSFCQNLHQPISRQYEGHTHVGNAVNPNPALGSSLTSMAYSLGTPTPLFFGNASQSPGPPPASASNLPVPGPNAANAVPQTSNQLDRKLYGTPPAVGSPADMGASPPLRPPGLLVSSVLPPPLADQNEAGPYPPQAGQMSKPAGTAYPSLEPGYQGIEGIPKPLPVHPPTPLYGFPPQQYQQPSVGPAQLSPSLSALSLQSQTPEALRVVNLLQERNILPPGPVPAPTPCLPQDLQKLNCSPEVFCSTLTSIPQTQALLNKAKLPLGLLLHPFKDLSQLPVVMSSSIVRCRSCRTYINPFVSFLDQRRWKCNLCYRVNDVPEDFMYNPVSRSYGEPHKRPEIQNATIEFIAPSEYMLRPPQPAVYLFVLDVSHNAVETGYLDVVCQSLLESLNSLPGDTRTKIGFITFDSMIHFYNLQEGLSQPQMLIVSDIEEIFLPTPDSLLVNLNECKELVRDLLKSLPQMFTKTMETHSALGPALQASFKLMSPTGGRVSVFQTQLPSLGVGALNSREDPNQRASAKDVQHLSPATDFYKKLALDCSGQQVAVDLFLLSGQYCDLATLGCVSRYSAGSIYFYPSYHSQHNPAQTERFQKDLKRYLTRKIGFEAVMRIRCTKGLSIHTFHGNFFVRSTDLLSLPNINPDAGFAVQMSIEENLVDMQVVSFQAALLYTSSKGERRIRVHTMCLPVVNSMSDIFAGADVQAITGLLASMAVDRSVTASLSDARDAMTNAAIDSLISYRTSVLTIQQPGLLAPACLRLFPLYILALLKQKAFRTGTSTRLDDRVFAMCQLKYQPLMYLMLMIHPSLYRLDNLTDEGSLNINDCTIPQPGMLQLSVEKLNSEGAFLMDTGSEMYLWVGRNCNPTFLKQVLGVQNYATLPLNMNRLPELDTAESTRTRAFISWLREQRPFYPLLHIVRDESPLKASFMQNMIEDRTESALSYYEFLLHVQQQVSK